MVLEIKSFLLDEIVYYLARTDQILTHLLYDFIAHSTVGLTCAILIIYTLVHKAQSKSLYGAWFANIFGIFFHELAHAIVGAILMAKPSKFIMIPKAVLLPNGNKTYILGRVECLNLRWYNRLPTAMAPLLLLGIALYLEKHYWQFSFVKNSFAYLCFYLYLQITLLTNAIPSPTDFREGFHNFFGVVLWVSIFSSYIYYSNAIYNISIDLIDKLL